MKLSRKRKARLHRRKNEAQSAEKAEAKEFALQMDRIDRRAKKASAVAPLRSRTKL